MAKDAAKFVAESDEQMCRLDLREGEIRSTGMDRERCKRMLRSILDE